MSKKEMVVYVDGSRRSKEVLEAIQKERSNVKVVYRSGPSEKIPAVETRTSLIEGYDNIRRYVLHKE